jgi:hypothetical protein
MRSVLFNFFLQFHVFRAWKKAYDATGIVTAAREYRAGRAVVLPYVLFHLLDESKKFIVEVMKMF